MARRGWPTWIAIFAILVSTLVLSACARPMASRLVPGGDPGASALPGAPPLRPSTSRILEAYGRVPLHFEENRGQTDARVAFLARGRGYGVFLTRDEIVLALREGAVRMSLVGARPTPVIRGVDALPGKVHHLLGAGRRSQTDISTFARVRYEDVYPGIDVVVYGNQRELEYDFVIAPGADPDGIRLRFGGADRLAIDEEGNVVVGFRGGTVLHRKPVIYQERDGVRERVAGSYVLYGRDEVAFRVGPYDRTRALVIDPVISYSTFLGGSSEDLGHAIAVDPAGNAYVAGETVSVDFPVANPAQSAVGGGRDAFVTKLNVSGSALVYSTYLGGSGWDGARALALDGAGNAYVTGFTFSTDFPIMNAFQGEPAPGASGNVFVAKLTAAGNALVYSTYLGGSASTGMELGLRQVGRGIAVDAAGSAYVAGYTTSASFPTTAGALRPSRADTQFEVAFVTKLAPDGGSLVYSTYLSGDPPSSAGADFSVALALAVDGAGQAYVAGSAASDFTTTPGAYRESVPANGGFVVKLNASGSALLYSTFLAHRAEAIALDAAGSAHVAGSTCPDCTMAVDTTAGAFQPSSPGADDGFVVKLSPGGDALVWGTLLGGSSRDHAFGVALDAGGAVHVVGWTLSDDFPSVNEIQPAFRGAFITKFAADGTVIYSTTIGQNADPDARQVTANGVAIDGEGNAYVTGWVGELFSGTFPITPGAFQSSEAGVDAFVLKLAPGDGGTTPPDAPPAVAITAPSNGAWTGNSIAVKASATDDVGLAKIEVYGNGGVILTTTCSGTSCLLDSRWVTGTLASGAYEIKAVVTDTAGNCAVSAPVTINKNATTPVHPSGAPTCSGGGGPGPDPTPPTVTMTGPADGSTVSGTITVSAAASDNVGVTGVQFKLDGANLGAEDPSAPYSVPWDTTTVANGTHTLSAVAKDAAGNTGTSATITVTVNNPPPGGDDPTSPTVTITAPTSGAWTGNSIAVKASASDNVGLTSIKVYGNGGVILEMTCSGTSCLLDSRWTTGTLANGAYQINAVATDTAGNCTISATVVINKNATTPVHPSGAVCSGGGSPPPPPPPPPPPDPTKPTVSITSPPNGAWTGNSIHVVAPASDNEGLAKIELYGNGGVVLSTTCSGTSCTLDGWWVTGTLANGAYQMNAVATDTAGNCAVSNAVTINKGATSPVKPSGAPSCP